MRIVVVSDTHGDIWTLQEIVEKHLKDTRLFIFLGDGEDDIDTIAQIYPKIRIEAVRGNCDFASLKPDSDAIYANGKKIYFTHGHLYGVKNDVSDLIRAAKDTGADILLFGHTHEAFTDYEDGLYIMNPGSLSGKTYGETSYGIIDIDKKSGIHMHNVFLKR